MFKIVKSMSETRFEHYLLSITMSDEFWRSHLDILVFDMCNNRCRYGKKSNFSTHFVLTFRCLTNNLMVVVHHLTMLAPWGIFHSCQHLWLPPYFSMLFLLLIFLPSPLPLKDQSFSTSIDCIYTNKSCHYEPMLILIRRIYAGHIHFQPTLKFL